MQDENNLDTLSLSQQFQPKPTFGKIKWKVPLILFCSTFLTTTIYGSAWMNKDFTEALNWHYGLTYSILIMLFLSAHEFGHYFAARRHKVDATLPYYIPMPIPVTPNFGTFGAVIRTRTPILSRKALFDIGVAGPLAGFIVCLGFIIYGLATLPTIDYIYSIHPEYIINFKGKIPPFGIFFGDTLLYSMLAKVAANFGGFVPPMNEIYHYPFLCVGWFGMFVTMLNLLPFGQLDGGHIVYAMFGNNQKRIARIFLWFIIFIGFGGILEILFRQFQIDYAFKPYIFLQNNLMPIITWLKIHFSIWFDGWVGWLIWAGIGKFIIKLDHPPIEDSEQLSSKRKLLGWLAIIILVFCFSFNGIYLI
ncbi:MAG: hypothetical protein HW421_180 [Ignavibacteria bacterium]|nr:hypothetical protein [Ignavibacteria bacterium]